MKVCWGGGRVVLGRRGFLCTPAPKDKLLLKPDSLVLTGVEGAEFG